MALIGKIRNHLGWLMLLMVALGVVGFLLMDATSMGNMGSAHPKDIGSLIVRFTVHYYISIC
jgi:preprotein translocase subunit SecG